jgi:hypothetical protein
LRKYSLRDREVRISSNRVIESTGENRIPAVVGGLPPKFLRRSLVMMSGFPFARNGSLSLQRVLDDAFARCYHNPLEDLLGGFLGLFSLGPRASARGNLAAGKGVKQFSLGGNRSVTES